MKTKDLLKYFLHESNLFTIENVEVCGMSSIAQIMDVFNCDSKDIFLSCSIIYPGDYLVTSSFIGLSPSFIIIENEVIRYFTLIEEE